ncbi:CLUMA_CG004788, isoform A [Clunio marinus]|uniref:CLUMA_CG004788, isoform A n=1 Tax=Clunio marinus TaxID=568069 RepID=A0A1J1HUQ8_9DIPT|nr:CLUMA_CG004788, isoform A [Clunio marinus]
MSGFIVTNILFSDLSAGSANLFFILTERYLNCKTAFNCTQKRILITKILSRLSLQYLQIRKLQLEIGTIIMKKWTTSIYTKQISKY